MCTTQLWLFLWGPINGRGLEVSLGYFLLPLVMVLVGCVLYKEKLSSFQMVAVALAMLGVGHEIWRIGSIAWETVYVALAYPLYFFMRRKFATDHLGGFWWDLFLILPVAFYLGFIYSCLKFIVQKLWIYGFLRQASQRKRIRTIGTHALRVSFYGPFLLL